MILPGWDNIQSVSRIRHYAEVADWILLFLLGVASFIAGIYGVRKDTLAELNENSTQENHAAEIAAIKTQGGWRRLSDENRAKIIESLKPFPGQEVSVWVSDGSSPECKEFSKQFVNVFHDSGWKCVGIKEFTVKVGPPPKYISEPARHSNGVEVAVNTDEANSEPSKSSQALFKCLCDTNLYGSTPRFRKIRGFAEIDPGKVELWVGER
jgi:hypothetical protein